MSISPPGTGSTYDTMTALTPAVNTAGDYYVQVEVYNLYSSLVGAPNFRYSIQVPIIISLGPRPMGRAPQRTVRAALGLAPKSR